MRTTLRRSPSATTQNDPDETETVDRRPRFAIGHVPLSGSDIGRLAEFYERIGFRKVARMPGMAILELRGGTHVAIHKGAVGETTLDLMVDDLDDTRDVLAAAGAEPSEIRRGFPHRSFTATDPEGNVLLVQSSHVAGPV